MIHQYFNDFTEYLDGKLTEFYEIPMNGHFD